MIEQRYIEKAKALLKGCIKADLPDTLKATRYRIKIEDYKVYIIICEDDDKNPIEIFAKFPYGRQSEWDAVCRLASLSLRYGIPLEEVIKQMEKSVKSINDMPSQISRILKTYQSEKGDTVATDPCPECGTQLVFESGCNCCKECGYSKCN